MFVAWSNFTVPPLPGLAGVGMAKMLRVNLFQKDLFTWTMVELPSRPLQTKALKLIAFEAVRFFRTECGLVCSLTIEMCDKF